MALKLVALGRRGGDLLVDGGELFELGERFQGGSDRRLELVRLRLLAERLIDKGRPLGDRARVAGDKRR